MKCQNLFFFFFLLFEKCEKYFKIHWQLFLPSMLSIIIIFVVGVEYFGLI